MKDLPPNVYLQSYLKKAGVRFDLNQVDTVVNKGFGLSFYSCLVLLVVLALCFATSNMSRFQNIIQFYILSALDIIYLLLYIHRVYKFKRIRRKLRLDNAPIIVEAYAVVIIDKDCVNSEKIKTKFVPKRSAIIYKESGSLKPRFFTGAITRYKNHQFYKEQIARVFIDRKNPALYSVDDGKFYKTASAKIKNPAPYVVGKFNTKLNPSVDEKIKD